MKKIPDAWESTLTIGIVSVTAKLEKLNNKKKKKKKKGKENFSWKYWWIYHLELETKLYII